VIVHVEVADGADDHRARVEADADLHLDAVRVPNLRGVVPDRSLFVSMAADRVCLIPLSWSVQLFLGAVPLRTPPAG